MKDGHSGKTRKAGRNTRGEGDVSPRSVVPDAPVMVCHLAQQGEYHTRSEPDEEQTGTWTADLVREEFDGSARTRELHGVPAEGIIPMSDAMAAVHPDHRADFLAAIEFTNRTGAPFSLVYRTAASEGNQWLIAEARVVEDDGTRRLQGIVRTISPEKLAEQALRTARDTLEQRVAERTAELQKANAALRDQSMRLQWALDASQAGTSKWDSRRGPYFEWDARERALFGFSAEEPVTMEAIMQRVHPDDRAAIYEQMEKEVPAGGHLDWNHEFRINHPTLGVRWIVGRGRMMRDEKDHSLSMAGINFDVTERKQAEVAFARKQEQLQAILDHSPALISIKDLEGNVILANRNFAVLDAPPLHEFVGTNVFDLFPEDVARKLWENDLAALKAGAPVQSEETVKHKDGDWHTYLTLKFPLFAEGGEPYGICAISTDITPRKLAEDEIQNLNATLEQRVAERTMELARSEERFRLLAESSFEGIATSRDGVMVDCNAQYAAMFGYDPEEIIGMPVLDLVAPDWREALVQRLRDDDCGRVEYEGLRKDGSVFPLEVRSHLIMGDGQKTRVGAVRDLSEIKEAEARLQAQQIELENVQRLAMVSEISAGIIHQISQPLSALAANIAAMSARLGSCGTQSCDVGEIVRDVEADVTRMRDVVVQLRSLVKGETAPAQQVDLNQLVADVRRLIEPEAKGYKVRIALRLASVLPPIRGNPVQLTQVLINLMRNAVDACATSPRKQRLVEIATQAVHGNRVELRVEDNGSGIAPELVPRLFQPFFTTKPEGVGIGLSLSRTILRAHDGTIEAFNNPDKPGVTVKILLPLGCCDK